MPNRSRRGRKIDFTHWHGINANVAAQSAGSNGQTVIAAGLAKPETLMRTRGNLIAFIDGASAPGKLVEIGVGLILMPGGTGTTLTSTPLADGDAPWFWYDRFVLGYEEMVTDVIDVPGLSVYRSVIDSKAMRVLGLDQEVQLVVENVTLGTAAAVNVSASFRFLFGS